MYLVTIEPLETTFFSTERPEGELWEAIARDTPVAVEEGVVLENTPEDLDEVYRWPGDDRPPDLALGVCKRDPRRYKAFQSAREVDGADYEPTGTMFGGLFNKAQWERALEVIPDLLALRAIPDTDPTGPIEEAVRNIRGRGAPWPG